MSKSSWLGQTADQAATLALQATPGVDTPPGFRFTRDGGWRLENRLAMLCRQVLEGVFRCLPRSQVAALILAGGYGRGEGGVLREAKAEEPYNDLEFYLFLRGNRLLNELRFGPAIHALAQNISRDAGLDVEIKLDSLSELRRRSVSMFSYDLVARHCRLFGPGDIFEDCSHHLDARRIPISEAARLLLNRVTGLLLAKAILLRVPLRDGPVILPRGNPNPSADFLTVEECDFVERNLAKMQLALGDALLAALGHYHFSCLERQARLKRLATDSGLACFLKVKDLHAKAVEFKLHPRRGAKSVERFWVEHQELSDLARQVWLWLEGRRFHRAFSSIQDYALSTCSKCDSTPAWRNWLLNLRTFGPKAFRLASLERYPRERLFASLPLLLWDAESLREKHITRHLQMQLATSATDWPGFLKVYLRIWHRYG